MNCEIDIRTKALEAIENAESDKDVNAAIANYVKLEEIEVRKKENEKNKKWIQIMDIAKTSIQVVGVILPACITIWVMRKTFKIEEDGFISSSVGKNVASQLSRNIVPR